jgi:hypothetical protein
MKRVHPLYWIVLLATLPMMLGAIAGATQWNVQTDGNDTNGGGFVAGQSSPGTDFSLVATKRTGQANNNSCTDVGSGGTTLLTTTNGSLTTALKDNIVYLAGGTGTLTGTWRQVTAAGPGTFTVDSNVAAGTGITLNIGGALLSPAIAAANAITGNTINIKSGTYTISTTSFNVAGGCASFAGGTDSTRIIIRGYGTTVGDGGAKPVLTADGTITNFTLVNLTPTASGYYGNSIINVSFNGNSRTGSTGIYHKTAYTPSVVEDCNFASFTNGAITYGTYSSLTALNCYATSNSGSYSFSCNTHGCIAIANAFTPFGAVFTHIGDISANNTGATTDGFDVGGASRVIVNCTAFGNGRYGVNFPSSGYPHTAVNVLSYGNTSIGFGAPNYGSIAIPSLVNCAADTYYPAAVMVNCATLTANPFIASGSLNFGLNTTTGGGTLCRSHGFPGAFPAITTTSYLDIGAVQHADPAGGGGGPTFSPGIQP